MAKKSGSGRSGSTGGGSGSRIRRSTAASNRFAGQWTPQMGTPF